MTIGVRGVFSFEESRDQSFPFCDSNTGTAITAARAVPDYILPPP